MTVIDARRVRDEEIVAAAARALSNGDLVIIPTDTVYGLAARADREDAVRRVFEAKRRPPDLPLPVLVPDVAAMNRYAHPSPAAVMLARAFWPGPLTIVVPRSEAIPPWVTAGEDTVGLRQPDHALAIAILRAVPFPVAVTSANISGVSTAPTAAECAAELALPVALVIEAGPLRGKPSTVLAFTDDDVCILRQGPISEMQIRAVLAGRPRPEEGVSQND
ncbi:MAG: threonylcarbamoyl-AMP synthase [Armatimonadetes bacterium]|nr:threonylcarbamoyl-AMP synthase [Armatimonadota bacterium]